MNVRQTIVASFAFAACAVNAATFTGELYAYWYDDREDCGLYRVEESWKNSTTWRTDYIEVDGKKEPALFGWDCYAFPVAITPGETFSAEVMHGTSTAAHIKSVEVLTDAQMYAMFQDSDEWKDGWGETASASMSDLWNAGTKSTRAWVVVEQKNVTSGATYTLDIASVRIVDRQTGNLSSTTLGEYAKRYGATISGKVKLTESVWYKVAIAGGETFPQRVWNVCDPFATSKYGNAIDKIEDNGGDEELYDAPGLYFVTADMTGGGSSGSVSIPEEWQKARTLNGVATRAMPHPYVGTFTVKCGKANKNGAAKVSAVYTPFSGKKTTYKAQTVDVTGGAATVSWDGLEVSIDGDEFRGGAGVPGGISVESANIGGSWGGATATVSVYADDVSMFAGEVLTELLPDGEQATANNGKWTFAKAASVKWAKPKKGAALPEIYDEGSGKGLIIDTTKGKTNLSGLKLSYASKDGTFKGKFRVYALEGEGKSTKLKKYSVSVTGIVVKGKGYGLATCKNPAVSWTVLVE